MTVTKRDNFMSEKSSARTVNRREMLKLAAAFVGTASLPSKAQPTQSDLRPKLQIL